MIISCSLPGIALNSRNSLPPHNVNRSSSIPSISDVQSNNNSNKSNSIASDNHFSHTSDAPYSIRILNSIPGSKSTNDNLRITNSINNKLVILSFDDNRKGDFTYAKPILDKYGFKATFFIICGKTSDRGAWHDIAVMQKDGMDIESHTMTHAHLNTLSRSQLDFEIGGSK